MTPRAPGSGGKKGQHPLLWRVVNIRWVDAAPLSHSHFRVAWVGDPMGLKPIAPNGEEKDRVWVPLGGIEMITEVE